MNVSIITNHDTSALDAILLDHDGCLKLLSSEVYEAIQWDRLRCWCHKNAIYGLPTKELVQVVEKIIQGRTAIEIGSGAGCLGKALGIPRTDNYSNDIPEVIAFYKSLRQPLIRYPKGIEKIDALSAIEKYHPKVVVGSWITQVYDPVTATGSVYGIDEVTLLSQIETYIVFGSIRNHGNKVIAKLPHQVIRAPFMWSRADDSALFIWNNHPKELHGNEANQ